MPTTRFLDRAERPDGRRAQWREAKQIEGSHVTPQACFPHDASEGALNVSTFRAVRMMPRGRGGTPFPEPESGVPKLRFGTPL
jgi:hypothetical protein